MGGKKDDFVVKILKSFQNLAWKGFQDRWNNTQYKALSCSPGLVQRFELRLTNVTLKLFNIRMRSHVIVQSCLHHPSQYTIWVTITANASRFCLRKKVINNKYHSKHCFEFFFLAIREKYMRLLMGMEYISKVPINFCGAKTKTDIIWISIILYHGNSNQDCLQFTWNFYYNCCKR